MAALSAMHYSVEMQDFFNRKVAEGKNKMSVINAVRNKLILRVFACVRDNRPYSKDYQFDSRVLQRYRDTLQGLHHAAE